VGFAFDALSYDTDTGAPVLAAALAFRVFLFEVPCVLVFVIVAGFVSDVTGRDITSSFHGQGIPHLTALSVSSAAHLSGWARFSGLVVALYALFLSARSLVKVLNIVHALVWNVPRRAMRGANRAAILFIGITTLLVALSLAIDTVRGESSVGGVTLLILYTFLPLAAWWWVSSRLPHRDCPLIALAPGAALFAVGLELLHVVTVVWFPRYIKSKSDLYGTIGISLVILLWAYLIGRVITLAAVLNAALWRRFGAEAAQPVQVRRPQWRVPLVDDKFSRIWDAMFGSDEHGDGEETGDDRTETT
jgi:membrane protein